MTSPIQQSEWGRTVLQINCAHTDVIDLDLLVPNPKNPNKHPDDQIKLLAKIMKHQGWRSPIVVSNRSGFITKGHGRLQAAKLNGWTQAPVDRQDYSTEADEYADMVADNKLQELSSTDMAMVNIDVMDLGPDFDLELLGIPDFVVEPMEKFEALTDDDDIPEHVEPRAKPGDIYQLGRHRLMCGDSTVQTHVEALMASQRARMVFTDPPWNVNYGAVEKGNAQGYSPRTILNDHMNDDKWAEFLQGVCANLASYTVDGCPLYCVMSAQEWPAIHKALSDAGFHWSSTIVWAKDRLVLSRKDYHTQYEPIWYGWKEGAARLKPLEDRKQSDLWQFDRPHRSDLHPTTKPVELIERALENSSNPKDPVLELFGGSGSTLIACEKLGRTCYAMELDPKYVDTIVTRWENYTGKKAELVVEGAETAPQEDAQEALS